VIRSFKNQETERVFLRLRSRRLPPDVARSALRKLLLIHGAVVVDDLKVPPGNRLEKLTGDSAGQFSVRVNDQWRICFSWLDGEAHDVEIVDYHS
jgi:proteic killer suppression protein